MPIGLARFAAVILLGWLGPADAAEVAAGALDVFDEPDPAAYATGRLRRGDRIKVVDVHVGPGGWLTIEPPEGAFDWVEESALGATDGANRAKIRALRATVRSGNPAARMPGPPRTVLERGAVVRLLDRDPLTVGQGSSARTWRAVAPLPDEVRYVRAAGARRLIEPSGAAPAPAPETQAAYLPPTRIEAGPIARPFPPPPAIAAELAPIDAEHRAIVRGPVESWQLESVRRRYEAVLKHVHDGDAASGAAIRARIDEAVREQDSAKAARNFEAIVAGSRRRDQAVANELRRLAEARTPRVRPFDAQGLMQPSSRRVEGRKVTALIGPEGIATAYLDIPPGLDAGLFLARRVGVRGTVHYNEALRARLVTVREIEPLDGKK